jgi:hypothetical protein
MKPITLLLFILLFAVCSYAQTWSGATPGNIFYNSGNVGIGTKSPAGKLSVQLASASGGVNGIGNVWDSTYSVFGTAGSTVGPGVGIAYDIANKHGSILSVSPGTSWQDLNYYANQHRFFVNNTEKVRIDASGNVGIGTTSPGSRLHINSGALAASGVTDVLTLQMQYATGNEIPRIKISNSVNTISSTIDFPLSPNSSSVAMAFSTSYNGTLGEKMRIDGTGNVGVGTRSPAGKLSVQLASASGGVNGIGNVWDSTYSVFGTAGSTVGSGVGIAYDIANNHGSILSVSPGTSWQDLNYYANQHKFFIGNTEKVRIDVSGNVGIGTISPRSRLHINSGALAASGVTDVLTLQMQYATGDEIPRIKISNSVNAISSTIDFPLSPNSSSVAMAFSTSYNGTLGEKMRIDGTGNVGIGTTSPAYKFHSYSNGNLSAASAFIAGDYYGPVIGTSSTSSSYYALNIVNSLTSPGVNAAGANSLLYVRADGNVGIGTTNPETKLTVKGKIEASEIQVKDISTIPDYVFRPDYKLMSLEQVKRYVNRNQHLPEVPSEKEFKEKGMNMAEMNALLLKKIEELTLYVIEQNKQLQEQGNEIKTLKRKIHISKHK